MSILLPSKPQQISGVVTNINNNTNTVTTDDSGLYIFDDNTPQSNITLKTNGITALHISDTQRIGINMKASQSHRLIINDDLGKSIRLVYNKDNENQYADFDIESDGSLTLKTYNNSYINFLNNSDNNITNIKINNEILYTNATQLNYNYISLPGHAEPLKSVILDNDKSIIGINKLSVSEFELLNTLALDINSLNYGMHITNGTGLCLKLQNNNNFAIFNVPMTGVLNIYNNNNIIEFLSDSNNNLIYPIHLTTENNLNNTGIGIKFNTYNNNNIKKNMASIETIITNNQNNNENSIIKFNNMNNGNLTNTVTIRNDGYILCNTIMELSDKRVKKIINKSNYLESLEKILSIKTYNYIYKNDSKKKIHKGIMAQELHDIIPSAVNIEQTDEFNDLYTVSNKELIGYLLDCIKALNYKIEKLS